MSKLWDLNPKFQQELISKVKNNEPYYDMFDKYTPDAIRDILEQATAEAAGNKHPYDLFEKPELLSKVPINYDSNIPEYGNADFWLNRDRTSALGQPMSITMQNRGDPASLIHETQHIYDQVAQPNVAQPLELPDKHILTNIKNDLDIQRKITSPTDLRGVEEAAAYYSSHFKPDVEGKFEKMKQLLNLERVVKGQPLKMIAPVMKAAGIGAAGLAVAGIGNKAMAGDFGGAALDTADVGTDFIPLVGEAKMALTPTETGNSELPPEEMAARDRFNKTKQRLLNK